MNTSFGPVEYTSASTLPVEFDEPLPKWLQVVGAGTVVVKNKDGSTGTFVCGGGEVITGEFRKLTSLSCTRLRMGSGQAPPAQPNAATASANAPGTVQVSVDPVTPSTPVAVGQNDPAFTRAGALAFGDGSDGACGFDGAATILGCAPVVNVYTLTRDIFASSIAIAAGVTVNAAGFRVFCSGTTTIAATGHLHNNGNAAVADAAGAASNTAGSTGNGSAGGAGVATATAGNAGTDHAAGFPGGTGSGGAGGTDGTKGGGLGGAYTALAAVTGGARNLFSLLTGIIIGTGTNATAALVSLIRGGCGGGAGGADSATTTKSGGGGGGAGVLILATNGLVNNGSISVDGGVGGAAASTGHNAGGGGGGGGGTLIIVCRTKSGSGTTTAAGGLGGAKAGAAGVAGVAGTAGNVIVAYC